MIIFQKHLYSNNKKRAKIKVLYFLKEERKFEHIIKIEKLLKAYI